MWEFFLSFCFLCKDGVHIYISKKEWWCLFPNLPSRYGNRNSYNEHICIAQCRQYQALIVMLTYSYMITTELGICHIFFKSVRVTASCCSLAEASCGTAKFFQFFFAFHPCFSSHIIRVDERWVMGEGRQEMGVGSQEAGVGRCSRRGKWERCGRHGR